MNHIVITGNLVKNPELRNTQNGIAVCKFTIANNKYAKGEQKTIFVNIVTFNKTAENCDKYLTKGSKVAVVGELEIRQYKDNEGQNKYMTEIIANEVEFLSTKNQNEEYSQQGEFHQQGIDIEIEDTDLPF